MTENIKREIAETLRVYVDDLTDEMVEEIEDLMFDENISVEKSSQIYASWVTLTQEIEWQIDNLYKALVKDKKSLAINYYNIALLNKILDVIDTTPQSYVDNDFQIFKNETFTKLMELYKTNRERFIIPVEWYEETIDEDYIVDDKEQAKDDLYNNFIDARCDYGYYSKVDFLEEIIEELGLTYTGEKDYDYYAFLRLLANQFIELDIDIKRLTEKSPLYINVFPLQEDNADTEGFELSVAIEELIKHYIAPTYNGYYYLEDDSEEQTHFKENKILNLLFHSQGYDFEDLADTEKVKNSPFLTSFINELENDTVFGSKFFTILLKTNVYDYIEYFLDKDAKLIISKENKGCMGLFNPTQGSGSSLEITLEKDLIIPLKEVFYQVEGRQHNYGYTVDSVYGLCSDAWSEDFTFKK